MDIFAALAGLVFALKSVHMPPLRPGGHGEDKDHVRGAVGNVGNGVRDGKTRWRASSSLPAKRALHKGIRRSYPDLSAWDSVSD